MTSSARPRWTGLSFVAALALTLLTACDNTGAKSTDGADSDLVTEIVEIDSCEPFTGAAQGFLGHPVEVTGTGDPCKFFVRDQIEINGAYFWTYVHFEFIPVDEDDIPRIVELISDKGLTVQPAPLGWSYAGSAPGELHYVLVDRAGMALHCDASTKPGGSSEGATPPGIDPAALLVFCEQVRDVAVEQE
jgi:hypothetical protein